MNFLRAAQLGLVGSLLSGVVLLVGCQNNTARDSVSAALSNGAEQAPMGQGGQSAIALQTAELMVEGTSCASCAVSIRRHLHKLQGIGEIREGSSKQHLLVEFDPQLVTTEQLVKAVFDAGYEAEVWVHGPT